jgi:ABC-2 type transport system ATP-binding protein
MATIEVRNITKTFGDQTAVDHVSFEVNPGEIFGLLGPNGAGKTTTIRTILDLFKPDSGEISILGGKMSEDKKNRIGYLPEERGLYQDITLENCLNYLAQLKGMDHGEAARKIDSYLHTFDLYDHRKKKLKEMSKGMQQKAQLISTLVHEPELVIIDEPFSALDPVNTQMVKDILRDQRQKGKTIVMCTHQMHQVEELCDRLVLIDHGQAVLYGNLNDIRRRYSGQDILVSATTPLPENLTSVSKIEAQNGGFRLHLSENATSQALLNELVQAGVQIEKFEIAIPTLDEIFIQVVTKGANPA